MSAPKSGDQTSLPALEARIRELESENRRLSTAAEGVAAANVNAALQMLEMNDANMRRLKAKNEQVEHALELALEANEQRTQFLANMSHELRTPISGILGLVDLLLASELGAAQRDQVEAIATTADSFLVLINQVLDFSKVNSDGLEIEAIDFDLWDTLENIAQLMQAQADQKNIEFLFELDPAVPRRVVGDPLRLRQILLNLGSNAIKFTERGVVSLHAESVVRRTEIDGSEGELCELCVHIEDTGCGISEEQGAIIFDAFRQADSSTTRRFGGTGLGLSICRELLDVMGGELRYTSTPDVGTSFRVELSFPVGMGAPAHAPVRTLETRQALVLAQRPLTEVSLSKHLPAMGFDVVIDVDAIEQDEHVALVLLESPLDLVGDLRTLRTRFPDAKLMLIDEAKAKFDTDFLRKHGVDEVLLRPVRPTRLAVAVENFDSPEEAEAPRNALGKRLPFAGAHVLVVEDTKINQVVFRQQLERLGCSVTIAVDGVAGLEAWRKADRFDLVFMDCHMPRMDGFETTRRLREIEEELALVRTPVLALTADARENVVGDCTDAGMDACCTKPLRQSELSAVLEHWIGVSTASGQPEGPTAR